jgi:DNA-3-methyladenine glycosylase
MLPPAFYARDAETVARALLGAVLVVGGDKRGRVVETEAYVGPHDLACHASKGLTKRTAVMFGPPGHAYVYLIYGMYDMLNVVTGAEGDPQAVLVRAVEPLSGVVGKTDGPGKLTRAFGVTRARHDGLPLYGPELWLEPGPPPRAVQATPRIGVDYAGDWKDAPLRFLDADSPFVSRRV